MKSIYQEIALAIRSTPMALDLEQKVAYAQRYWTARHPQGHTMERITGVKIEPRNTHIVPTAIVNRNTQQQPQSQELRKADPMEELAKQFAEMTAHLSDVVKEFKRQPVQKFAAMNER